MHDAALIIMGSLLPLAALRHTRLLTDMAPSFTAHSRPWPCHAMLRRSFPKADIGAGAQHFDRPEVRFADFADL